MLQKYFKPFLALAASCFLLQACQKWEDHNAITDPHADKDLLQQIKENSDLSQFAELLARTGYDKEIASSKTYTVFAPTNAALAALDPTTKNDTAKLRLFIGNHIAGQVFRQSAAATNQLRLKMLNNKYNNWQGSKLEAASIVKADLLAKNGVLHVIDQVVPALPNAWEFLETSSLAPAEQKKYMQSIYYNIFDSANAVQIGVDPNTGQPVYQPGTDSMRVNHFWRTVYDLRDESREFTFFMLVDTAWDSETVKHLPFFVTTAADSSLRLSRWAVVKDFAVEGSYDATNVPDTLVNKFNVKMGIDKSAIVSTVKTSNGTVFIMKKLAIKPQHKFPSIVVQAENYILSSHDRRNNTYFRQRYNPLTGFDFTDVLVFRHGVSLFHLGYQVNGLPSGKYRAYWVALNDNINNITATFTQKLGIGTPTAITLGYVNVMPNNFAEVYLGEFTLTRFTPQLKVYLTGANSTAEAQNILVCDYFRLEPVVN